MPLNLPNSLTLARIVFAPLLVVVLLTELAGRRVLGLPNELAGALIFALASITDWLDGFLARRRRQVTWIGQMLDPIADKLLTSAAFVSLVALGLAPAWMVALIIGREFVVTGLRSLAYTKGITIPASGMGKTKMVSQVTAILLLLVGSSAVPWMAPLGYVALWAVMIAAFVSAVDYWRRFQRLTTARVTDVNVARERGRADASAGDPPHRRSAT